MLPFSFLFYCTPRSLFPAHKFLSLCRVSFTAAEIFIFMDNSHAWYPLLHLCCVYIHSSICVVSISTPTFVLFPYIHTHICVVSISTPPFVSLLYLHHLRSVCIHSHVCVISISTPTFVLCLYPHPHLCCVCIHTHICVVSVCTHTQNSRQPLPKVQQQAGRKLTPTWYSLLASNSMAPGSMEPILKICSVTTAHTHTQMHTHLQRERERERGGGRQTDIQMHTHMHRERERQTDRPIN